MKKRKRKKERKKKCEHIIEDVAMEVSLDKYWRKKIFDLNHNEKIELSYVDQTHIPLYVLDEVLENKFEFWITKVHFCNEKFDDGLIIFKFQSKEFPKIIRFSGNNSNTV